MIVKDHTIMFLDSINLTANLQSLRYNDTEINGFNPDVYDYVIELPEGTFDVPVLCADAESPDATIEITDPVSVPGWARITVLARDKVSYHTYNVYYSVNNSYSDAMLDSIKVGGSLIENFDPEILEYDVVLPSGTTIYLPVSGYAQVAEAKVVVTRPASFPGIATIVVTAVDDSTTLTYSINLSITTNITVNENQGTDAVFINPFTDKITFHVIVDEPALAYLKVWDITGILVGEKTFHGLLPGESQLCMEGTYHEGVYIYRLNLKDELITGKLVNW